jgi:hypothetical protein
MFAFPTTGAAPTPDPVTPRREPGAPRELPAGLADRVRPTTPVAGRTLPVPAPLAPLFPGGSLRRGTTTVVSGQPGHGATTLALALLGAASAAGSWCAAVGLPDPGVVAAAGLGLDLRRVVFVPHPGTGWAEAAGDLLSGVDAVLVRPPGRARLIAARHLTARARDRQAALVVLLEGAGSWPEGGDISLVVGAVEWEGVGRGHGYLRGRRAEVRVSGRRAAGRTTECSLWLPADSGAVATAESRSDGSARTGRSEAEADVEAEAEAVESNGTVGRHLVPRAPRGGAAG